MRDSPSTDARWAEVNAFKDSLIAQISSEAIGDQDLCHMRAGLGIMVHDVCDLSVLPTSPAANTTLMLAALALRLADYIKGLL